MECQASRFIAPDKPIEGGHTVHTETSALWFLRGGAYRASLLAKEAGCNSQVAVVHSGLNRHGQLEDVH